MKRIVIAASACFFTLVLIVAGATLIIPHFVDLERHKPLLEQLVSDKTGLPVRLGGDISLSLFPYISLHFSDLKIFSPIDHDATLATINRFEVRLKTIPLLSKNIEIRTFKLDGPSIHLVKDVQGNWNWQRPTENAPASTTPPPDSPAAPTPTEPEQAGGFVLNSLVVGEFSLNDGRIVLEDRGTGQTRTLSEINLYLNNVSLDQPIAFDLQAVTDNQPLQVSGSFGPIGASPGIGALPINVHLKAFETVSAKISGSLIDIAHLPSYQLTIFVEPFDLKQLAVRFNPKTPVKTSDPTVLQRVSFNGTVSGSAKRLELTDAACTIDDTTITLQHVIAQFPEPSVDLAATVDNIDISRYLPPAPSDDAIGEQATESPAKLPSTNRIPQKEVIGVKPDVAGRASAVTAGRQTVPYEPLRKLALQASLSVTTLRYHKAIVESITLQISGNEGLYTINPFSADLYQGNVLVTGTVDLRRDHPAAAMDINLRDIQAGPLLVDFANKNIIEGRLNGNASLSAAGDRTDSILSSLDGTANLLFQDGAIIGLDLAQLARTITSGFSVDQQGERPTTDFAELQIPVSVDNGLASISNASLKSPFIRAQATGTVNLVNQSLNLRVEPRLVATIQGQGADEAESKSSGITVPVLVAGTISAPTFSPDLEALAREQLPDQQELKKIIETGTIPPERKDRLKKEVEKAKGLLKGLLGR